MYTTISMQEIDVSGLSLLPVYTVEFMFGENKQKALKSLRFQGFFQYDFIILEQNLLDEQYILIVAQNEFMFFACGWPTFSTV